MNLRSWQIVVLAAALLGGCTAARPAVSLEIFKSIIRPALVRRVYSRPVSFEWETEETKRTITFKALYTAPKVAGREDPAIYDITIQVSPRGWRPLPSAANAKSSLMDAGPNGSSHEWRFQTSDGAYAVSIELDNDPSLQLADIPRLGKLISDRYDAFVKK